LDTTATEATPRHASGRWPCWRQFASGFSPAPNKIVGSRRVANTAAKKSEAKAKGREIAIRRKVAHLIHNKDGTIGQHNSFGSDRAAARGSLRFAAGPPPCDG
jgi:hypothetical protein